MRPLAQTLDQAIAAFRAGALDDAAALVDTVLRAQPRNPLSLRLAADIASARGDPLAAIASLRKAVKLAPADGQLHATLALALQQTGQLDEARVHHQRAVAIRPQDPAILANRAMFLAAQGEAAAAIAGLRRAVELAPEQPGMAIALAGVLGAASRSHEAERVLASAEARFPAVHEIQVNRAEVLARIGRHDEAERLLRAVIAARPDFPLLYLNLAVSLEGAGRFAEAVQAYEQVLAAQPDLFEAHQGLANALRGAGREDDAIAMYRRALALDANRPEVHCSLGQMLFVQHRYDEAAQVFQAACAADARRVLAWAGLGDSLSALSRMEEAAEAYRNAAALAGDDIRQQGRLLLNFFYASSLSPERIRAEHERWARAATRAAEATLCALPAKAAARPRATRLRIGYLSPDVCAHSVAFFFEPVLARHDRESFEVHCFSTGPQRDAVTQRLRALAEHWHDVHALDDADLFAVIARADLDILVDLAGHTLDARPGVLAMRPAPLQVTWLGYPGTTGLAQVDYRFSDAIADPPGTADAHCVERLWRLDPVFCCYLPEPQPLPQRCAQRAGVTFGCYNNPRKLSDRVIDVWSRLLVAVPDARLVLKGHGFEHEGPRAAVLGRFAACGADPQRIDLRPQQPARAAHLASYADIDIALDPFPYNGTTTTMEALWMGVPVVALAGDRHAARVSATLLHAAGFPELIASSESGYVEIACALASDRERRQHLHARLRPALERSPLLDHAGFVRGLEAAYRQMLDAA